MKRIPFYLLFLLLLQSCGTLKETKRIELDFTTNQTAVAPTEIPREDVSRIGGFASITWNLNIIK